jgi:hypothetical protein
LATIPSASSRTRPPHRRRPSRCKSWRMAASLWSPWLPTPPSTGSPAQFHSSPERSKYNYYII